MIDLKDFEEIKNSLPKYKAIYKFKKHIYIDGKLSKKEKVISKVTTFRMILTNDNVFLVHKVKNKSTVIKLSNEELNLNFLEIKKEDIELKPKSETIDNVKLKFLNKKFNMLIPIEYLYTKNRMHYMKCLCDCGNETTVATQELGSTKSCGCYRKSNSRKIKTYKTLEKEIFSRYKGIKQRCYYESDKSYKWYGAKGITMCDEWLNNFDSFYNWCIENGFKKELHIDKDRLCKELNIFPHIYSPETCEFTTLEENNKHQTSNYKIEYKGTEYNLADLSRKLSIKRAVLKSRYENNNDLLTGKDLADYSSYYSMSELADLLNYSRNSISKIIIYSGMNDKFTYIKNKKYLRKIYFDEFKNTPKVKAHLFR